MCIKEKVFTFASKQDKMTISILQTDIAWAQPGHNAQQAEMLINECKGSDLYVLPEMWSTGFATSPEGIAETDNRSLKWMQEIAEKKQAAVCGSLAIKDVDGTFRNRHYFVKPDTTYQFYDKRHLFSYGGEDKNYTRGENRVVVEYLGWRFLLLTCYDLRFPVWSRNRNDYDAIIYVANWPESRQQVWDTLLRARAIENQCYVIAANRVGKDKECSYAGGSCIIDAKGMTITDSRTAKEQMLTAELSKEKLEDFRNKFQVLKDRD